MGEESFGGAALLWACRGPDSTDVAAVGGRVKPSRQSVRAVSPLCLLSVCVSITSLNVRVLFGEMRGQRVAGLGSNPRSAALPCSLALAKGLSYSEPQFSLSGNGHYNSTCLVGDLCERHNQNLEHSKHS